MTAAAQTRLPDLRPEVETRGRIKEITIDPRGRVWVSTATGYLFRSDDLGRSWVEVPIESRKPDSPDNFFSDFLSRVTFFDAQRAIITGYIGNSSDQAFLTQDGGLTWRSDGLPASLWVYDAQATSEGKAWLVGSSGDLLFSGDYGTSWERLPRPFPDEVIRTAGIHMRPDGRGVVSSLGDGLSVTVDGGRSWAAVETPKQQLGLEACEGPADRVRRPRVFADEILALQCGKAFHRDAAGRWSELGAGKPIVAYELSGKSLLLVTEDLKVHRRTPEGPIEWLGFELDGFPIDLAVHGDIVGFIDAGQKVTTFDGEKPFSSYMLRSGVADSWPIQTFDRAPDGHLWGVSGHYLYRSGDHAATWERIAELPRGYPNLRIDRSGDPLLWDGHGWTARWNVDASRWEPVPGLEDLDVVDSFRRADVWLLFGGRQWETAGRIEVARTYFSGQFSGSVDYGWVAASTDGGRTWKVVDRWQEGGPQELFLGDDNRLSLLSWLGAVRQGRLSLEPLGARMTTTLPVSDATWTAVPYVERAFLLDFLSERHAWIRGWTHHLGEFLFRSRDGGTSWKRVPIDTHPVRNIFRLFDGTWIGYFDEEEELRLWNGKRFEPLVALSEEPKNLLVDSNGQLIVELADGGLRVLDLPENRLKELATAQSSEGGGGSEETPAP